MPKEDAVVAITSGVKNMQAVLDVVWDELLPALKQDALPADEAAASKLAAKLKGLTLRPQEGAAAPGSTVQAIGKTYKFPANDRKLEAIALERSGDGPTTLVIRSDGADQRFACAPGGWTKGRLTLAGVSRLEPASQAGQPVALSAAWTADDVYTARIAYVQTPFVVTLNLKFEGDTVHLTTESNVAFGPTRQPELVGKAE